MTAPGPLAGRAASGAKWSFISVAGRRAVTLVTAVILARLLSPADFGLVAMAAVFVGFVDLLRDIGTGAGIVQHAAEDDDLLSSVFWLNLALGVLATGGLIAAAPLAAGLLRQPALTAVLPVLSVSILFAATSVVQTSLLTRRLQFRRLALIELAGAATGGVVGVGLALNGDGVWSLVWQSVVTTFAIATGTWLTCAWRPRLIWRAAAIRPILGFSANLTGFNVLNYFLRNADSLLIGRYLGALSLGFYDLAYRAMLYPLQLISWALGRALFPVYAQMREDPARLASAYLRSTHAIGLVAFPMIFGLVSVADVFVAALFGPAWAPVVPVLLVLGPLAALQAIATTTGSVYRATGRTDLLFRWGLISGALVTAGYAIGLQWGIVGVAAGHAVTAFALAYYLFAVPLRLIGLSVGDLLASVSRPLAGSLGMLVAIVALKGLLPATLDDPARLAILVAAGIVLYSATMWLWSRDTLLELGALARRAE